METFDIELAKRRITICCQYKETKEYCKDYLLPDQSKQPDIEVHITKEQIQRERQAAEQEYGADAAQFSDAYLETLAVYRQIAVAMPQYRTLLFHGSVIAVDGEAYLFTAPSGTGKSTHTRLWREVFGERAMMVNDDKPLLQVTEAGQVIAYGTPWNGKHRLGNNIGVPLKGICILERGEENHIRPVKKEEVFQIIYQQSYRPRERKDVMLQSLALLDCILELPLWKLACTISKEAVSVAYEAMSKEEERETCV